MLTSFLPSRTGGVTLHRNLLWRMTILAQLRRVCREGDVAESFGEKNGNESRDQTMDLGNVWD